MLKKFNFAMLAMPAMIVLSACEADAPDTVDDGNVEVVNQDGAPEQAPKGDEQPR